MVQQGFPGGAPGGLPEGAAGGLPGDLPAPKDLAAIFPDWSPYRDLGAAARAYLRDPDLALKALDGVLADTGVLSFTLQRYVTETNGVWQEVAVCDGARLVLWHGEDTQESEGQPASMTSSVRVLPLSAVTEVGLRQRVWRDPDGTAAVDAVDVYVLLSSLAEPPESDAGSAPRQDVLRFVKTLDDGGAGQVVRLEEFARTLASLVGPPH